VRDDVYDLFAITAPGLEPVCAAELRSLGIAPGVQAEAGGVSWRGDGRSLYRANLECRTSSRIIARAGSFRARTFAELERHARRLAWDRLLRRGSAVTLRVTSRKSKLYHEGAVAERLQGVLGAAVSADVDRATRGEEDDDVAGAQLVIVRVLRDVCTISVDASGALLHRRGYRQAVAKAPLRETLAAALLLAAGWRGDRSLLDPMCGSGTIAIEAALLARRIPPGLANPLLEPRAYAFQQWPLHDDAAWRDVVDAARARVLSSTDVPVFASDRDAGAVGAAHSNAERAGVASNIRFTRASLSAVEPPPGAGHLVTNPPYGTRIGARRALRPLYAALGRLARERLPDWTVALLAADGWLADATGLDLEELLATRNGGIAVRLLATHLPAAAG
jgi:putative N6-adenine-specific DNA methylase